MENRRPERWAAAAMLAFCIAAAGAGEPGAAVSTPWALVEERAQRVPCQTIADVLTEGGGGPLRRLDDRDAAHDPAKAWQCYWDSPSGVYFYGEFDVDLVAPERQLSAGLRDFREDAERDCDRVHWTQAVAPAPGYRLVARGRARCLAEDGGFVTQHVLLWLLQDSSGQRLLNLQHNHYAGDVAYEAGLGSLIRFMERVVADE
ncbi:MAG: hypothetical protein JJT90_06195 [Ectothiorhodospiraceae bacterium]|nr:hypothetical protein [Ectothiorhodospiraceae bacterium]